MKIPNCYCGGKREVVLKHGHGKAVVKCKKCDDMRIYDENKPEPKRVKNALPPRRFKKK